MPKHKKRNTFSWITWGLNTFCYWNLTSLYQITEEKLSSKNSKEIATWKLVPGCLQTIKHNLY